MVQKVAKIELPENKSKVIGVLGKKCTGKSSLVKSLLRYLNVYSTINEVVLEVMLQDGVKFLDSVYRIPDSTQYLLFSMPDEKEESKMAKEENIIRQLVTHTENKEFKTPILDRNEFLMHYEIQDFISVDDLLKKIGKSQRIFGKGGMIDLNKTRNRVLVDWYTGKLNELISK